MKDYVTPTIEIVELRPEERLATCHGGYTNYNLWWNLLSVIFCGLKKCAKSNSQAHGCS
ncbi:hypothetical protein SAMN02745136_05279 [Anaerocolumna jejuensis DSM 15929]|uniref:Uncharacterized protein n=1 Tax=Anaerocolumna jejuensis DSM 15929 TaxID=1121322 RepID=A0A1M7BYH8_9FIRM|nr:hypothetical protein [Anaerocolumna jejuensis]SHL60020.1 hypothetical protein SAMN02745136_05279 [Anaerocolumna jejuensis DSM 15929]